jgi:hypothetical protein
MYLYLFASYNLQQQQRSPFYLCLFTLSQNNVTYRIFSIGVEILWDTRHVVRIMYKIFFFFFVFRALWFSCYNVTDKRKHVVRMAVVLYYYYWISREPVAWPWCNLAASQRRPYCASVNSHCPLGLVIRQWDAVDWAWVLCDPSHSQIFPLSTAILALGKARIRREPNLGCRGTDVPGWFDSLPKTPWEL